MTVKEKLAVLTAVQLMVSEFTGESHTNDEQYAAIGKLIAQEFPANEHTEGKGDGEALLDVLVSLLETLTAELLAVTV